jgi:putative ABC transport system ATP-binding protein
MEPAPSPTAQVPPIPLQNTTIHNSPVLRCDNIEKFYGSRGNITKALNGISFTVNKGEYVAIMGASGSGKTTLLNCISSIDRVTAGHIYVADRDITALRSKQLSQFRRDELGFIFQDSNILDTLTAYENIALALTIKRVPPREIERRVAIIAEHLSITDTLQKFPYQLSGGQKQRVAAARAIITNPSLILADEPTGALDSKSAKMLLESFDMLNNNLAATILMVTHDSFAASYTKRAIFIQDGKVFTELVRGDLSRKAFFSRIIEVVSFLGGEDNDVL